MIVKCDEEHASFMLNPPEEAPCGKVYDDAECSTICPHNPLPPGGVIVYDAATKTTREEFYGRKGGRQQQLQRQYPPSSNGSW